MIKKWVNKYFRGSRIDMLRRLEIHLDVVWHRHQIKAKQALETCLKNRDKTKLCLLDQFGEELGEDLSILEKYFLFDMVS